MNSALALTETNPFRCRISPHELRRSAAAMASDDPRWEIWEHQVRRVLAKRRRHNRGRAA